MSNVFEQRVNAEKIQAIVHRKLTEQGFTFVQDQVSPPAGMGHFSASEKIEQAYAEAINEIRREHLSVVPQVEPDV